MKTNTMKTTTWRLASAIIAFAAIGVASYAQDQKSRQQQGPKTQQEARDPQATSQIVESYEAVSEALVQDDLSAAQKASAELVATAEEQDKPNIAQAAGKVADASTLEEARDQFKKLSSQVIALAKGNDEYTVMTCPMVKNGRWLQSDEQVSNPYMGLKMPGCGMPESKKGMMMDGIMDKEGMKGMNGMMDGMMMQCMKRCCMENMQEG